MTKFSVLDLAPIVEGSNAGRALANTLDLARHAEAWGYTRYWLAEHHNMQGIASSATAVVIGHVAQGTRSIRVGSGGIMLPNHAPLVIAEQFGTLEALFPGRIDLGLGRAPGTDQQTSMALRRTLQGDIDEFPRDVMELKHYLAPPKENQRVHAVPGGGAQVPIWMLGSSLYGAQLAALLGLPFAFASHFAPAAMMQAIDIYRTRFEPSAQQETPYIMLGFNVCAGETDDEARYLRTSATQSFLKLRSGTPGRLPPPVEGLELTPGQQKMLDEMRSASAVGSAETITKTIDDFLVKTGADELIVSCQIYEHSKRLRSYEIISEVVDLQRDAAA